MKTVVYQVIRRTNGAIKTIRELPAHATKRGTSYAVQTPGGNVITMAPRDIAGTRGRPSALPKQLVPVGGKKAGAPLAGTFHEDSMVLKMERRILSAKIAIHNQDVTSKLRSIDWLDIYAVLERTLTKKRCTPPCKNAYTP